MGNWRLEAFKMTLYMAFPVGVFWWFNQPAFFEDWMIEKRRQLYPPEDPKVREGIQQAVVKMREREQAKLEKELGLVEKDS